MGLRGFSSAIDQVCSSICLLWLYAKITAPGVYGAHRVVSTQQRSHQCALIQPHHAQMSLEEATSRAPELLSEMYEQLEALGGSAEVRRVSSSVPARTPPCP